MLVRCLALAILLALTGSMGRADDWPQWRGPTRDAVWRETGIVDSFPPDGPRILWRAEVGYGYASPVVANGRVYLTDAKLTEPDAVERVLCFNAEDGTPMWSYEYVPRYPKWVFTPEGHRGPTPTPIVHDGKLHVLGGMGTLFCFDAANGAILWKKDLVADFEMQVPDFGTDASPLIEGDLLILLIGGKPGAGVVALDRHTGREAWRSLDERRPYSSPVVISAGGERQLILWTQKAVTSLDPRTGHLWWRIENPITDYSVATPVHVGDRLLVGGLMLRLDADKPHASTLWPERISRRVLSNTSTPLLRGGFVYSARSGGGLLCLNADTGEEVWRNDTVTEPLSGTSIHLTPLADRVMIYTEKGELVIARLSPAGYEEISRAALIVPTYPFGGRNVTWSPPAFANRCVFARTDRQLVCASLAAKP